MNTVLVVDDDPDIREQVCEKLNDSGYKTLEASSGEEAVSLFAEQLPDLVVPVDHCSKRDLRSLQPGSSQLLTLSILCDGDDVAAIAVLTVEFLPSRQLLSAKST